MESSGNGDEVLLKYLQRDDSAPGSPVLGNEIDGAPLFRGCGLVIRVYEDVGVEETTDGHYLFENESRPG